jgi:hypothetical protein
MKLRTFILPPGRLLPGMTVAVSLPGHHGGELLRAGMVLDDAMIDSLRRRAVRCVSVTVPDTRSADEIAQETTDAEKRLAHIFRGNASATRDALRDALLNYRRGQLK